MCSVPHNAYRFYSISRFSSSRGSALASSICRFFKTNGIQKKIYTHLYHCLYWHASWSRTFETVFFLFPFLWNIQRGNEGEKECMHVHRVRIRFNPIVLCHLGFTNLSCRCRIESILKEHRWSRGWNLEERERERFEEPLSWSVVGI